VKTGKRLTIAMMPKAKGDPYFISCRAGAEEAAKEADVDLIWDGPTGLDASKQNEVVEGWITRGVDAIAVAVENGPGISTVLRKARARGIKVVTWDADAQPDARDYFVNQATPQGIGYTLTDAAARGKGRVRYRDRRAERGQSEPVDREHPQADRGEVAGSETGDDPTERRRS
jgi:rhamnose transport system permease protein